VLVKVFDVVQERCQVAASLAERDGPWHGNSLY
jgi:hypothetical protein